MDANAGLRLRQQLNATHPAEGRVLDGATWADAFLHGALTNARPGPICQDMAVKEQGSGPQASIDVGTKTWNHAPAWAKDLAIGMNVVIAGHRRQSVGGLSEAQVKHLKELIMSTKEEILAKVAAVRGMAESIAAAVDELNGEFATISEQIEDLKRQIREGQTPDLTELEAEVDKTAGIVSGLSAAVKANPGPT